MKALYEGTSRKKAVLIIIDDRSIVEKRKKERDISMKTLKHIKRWIEDAPINAEKFDKGKRGPSY